MSKKMSLMILCILSLQYNCLQDMKPQSKAGISVFVAATTTYTAILITGLTVFVFRGHEVFPNFQSYEREIILFSITLLDNTLFYGITFSLLKSPFSETYVRHLLDKLYNNKYAGICDDFKSAGQNYFILLFRNYSL
ncbi:hypothetical protein A3Q56_05372 [Intoshia linei]|uniref:Uncharacterized protein n=1 Tax=Intoshia linei TaxID=1819745 RepID=A0A177AZJ4_9BILA|nr:hypothetical protein A3Q56_05372 [Intoshia linei]